MADCAPSLDTDRLNASQPTSPERHKNQGLKGECLVPEMELEAGLKPC